MYVGQKENDPRWKIWAIRTHEEPKKSGKYVHKAKQMLAYTIIIRSCEVIAKQDRIKVQNNNEGENS